MSPQRKPRIGLFLRGGDFAYQNGIIGGAHQECTRQGVDLYCFAGGLLSEPDPRNVVYELTSGEHLDGAIVVPGTMAAEDGIEIRALVSRLAGANLCCIGSPVPGVPALSVDNETSVRALTTHLIADHGRRRVAFVTGSNNESRHRQKGYESALEAAGLAFDERLVIAGDYSLASGGRAVARLFDEQAGCDAIVAANDWMALGALAALEARRIAVPEDVALVGFDDVEPARFAQPPLTTTRQHPRTLGIRAVRKVLGQGEGWADSSTLLVPTEPILRQSCGCRVPSPHLALSLPSTTASAAVEASHQRDAWVRTLQLAAPPQGELTDDEREPDFAERLVDALLRDLEAGTSREFVMVVDGVVRQSALGGEIASWHASFSALRSAVVSSLSSSPRAWLQAESAFESAHVVVSGLAEQAQAQRRLQREAVQRCLEDMSVDVRMALDVAALRAALGDHLPDLRVPSLYTCAPDQGSNGTQLARILVAYDDERGIHDVEHTPPFAWQEVIPIEHRPRWRHSMLVKPLFFDDSVLGMCAIEFGTHEADALDALPDLIGTALKGVELAKKIAEEATRRERAERARMSQELLIASRIQTGILPRDASVPGLAIATAMLPAAEVGGDYFDILPCADGCWLGIGDVAGHGLHTGLVMLMIQGIVSTATLATPQATPSSIWTTLNAVLHDNVRGRLGRDEHATLTLIRYHADGRFEFSGAHEELLIYRARSSKVEVLESPGVWAGIRPDPPPDSLVDARDQLGPGDVLLLYTDGVTERRSPERGLFGLARLCEILERVGHEPVEAIRDAILNEVEAWSTSQHDDLSLVVMRQDEGAATNRPPTT